MFGLRRGWTIEPPPAAYAAGPTQTPGTSELRVSPDQANYLCHLAGVWKNEPQGFPVACFNPRTNQVILPDKWPSSDELDQMRAHEMGHARGWRHNDDGTGTGLASVPPKGLLALGATASTPAPPPPENPLAKALNAPR